MIYRNFAHLCWTPSPPGKSPLLRPLTTPSEGPVPPLCASPPEPPRRSAPRSRLAPWTAPLRTPPPARPIPPPESRSPGTPRTAIAMPRDSPPECAQSRRDRPARRAARFALWLYYARAAHAVLLPRAAVLGGQAPRTMEQQGDRDAPLQQPMGTK